RGLKNVATTGTFVLAATSLTLGGCGQKQQSELKHNIDEPVRSTQSWQWVDVPNEIFKSTFEPFLELVLRTRHAPILKKDDPITLRAQAWLDRFDARLRADHPEQFVDIPKPKALVMVEESPNAFVMP